MGSIADHVSLPSTLADTSRCLRCGNSTWLEVQATSNLRGNWSLLTVRLCEAHPGSRQPPCRPRVLGERIIGRLPPPAWPPEWTPATPAARPDPAATPPATSPLPPDPLPTRERDLVAELAPPPAPPAPRRNHMQHRPRHACGPARPRRYAAGHQPAADLIRRAEALLAYCQALEAWAKALPRRCA